MSFIVDQTEKYSTLVAESMNKTGVESVSHSVVSSRAPSPSNLHHTSDGEIVVYWVCALPAGLSKPEIELIHRSVRHMHG